MLCFDDRRAWTVLDQTYKNISGMGVEPVYSSPKYGLVVPDFDLAKFKKTTYHKAQTPANMLSICCFVKHPTISSHQAVQTLR